MAKFAQQMAKFAQQMDCCGSAFSFYGDGMLNRLASFAALIAAPLAAQAPAAALVPPALTLADQASLRCAAAVAMVAAGQAKGEVDALAYPPLAARGREYFVRTAARLMDDTGATRADLQAMMLHEAAAIRAEGPKSLPGLMPPCLSLMDAELPQAVRPAR